MLENKKNRLQITYVQKKKRKRVIGIKLEFILSSKVNNCPSKYFIGQLAMQQQNLRLFLRKFTIPQLVYINPIEPKITLLQQMSLILKENASLTKKQIEFLDFRTNLQVKYWKRMIGRTNFDMSFDPNRGLVYANVSQKCEDCIFFGELKQIHQIEWTREFLKSSSQLKEIRRAWIGIYDQKFIKKKEQKLQLKKREASKQFDRIIHKKTISINWQKSLLKTSSNFFPSMPLSTLAIQIDPFLKKPLTSKVKLFRHIFLTELITQMIMNQFGRNKNKQWKYRSGRTNYEYVNQQLQELRSFGHRFSEFRDYSVQSFKNDLQAQEQSSQSSDEASQCSEQEKNESPLKKKKKTEVQKMGRKIKKVIKKKGQDLCNFIVISGQDKSQINKRRYCLHQMTRQTDKTQALINFIQLVFSSYWPKKQLLSSERDSKSIKVKRMAHFVRNFRVKRQAASCLKEYTRESFFHKVLNIGLRALNTINQLTYLRLPFFHVFWSIKTIYHRHKRAIFAKKSQKNQKRVISLYRGYQMTEKQMNILKENIDGFIEMEGFLSTTLREEIADFFVTNTKIVIQVPVSNLKGMFDNGFAHVSNYSEHPNEREILINAFNLFKIKSVYTKQIRNFEINVIYLEYGPIKQIEQKVQKSENFLQSQFLMKTEERQMKIVKHLLEMKEERMTEKLLIKLKQKLSQEQQKLKKWKNTLKTQQKQEFSQAYKKLSKWEQELLSNSIHQEEKMREIENYGQLLVAVGEYQRGAAYCKRMLKQVQLDRAVQGWQWRKNPCLFTKQLTHRMLISECYSRLGMQKQSLVELQTLKDSYESLNQPQDEGYIKLLIKLRNMYWDMLDLRKYEDYERQLQDICGKFEVSDVIRKQDSAQSSNNIESIEDCSIQKLKSLINTQKNKLNQIQMYSYGKYTTHYLEQEYFLIYILNTYEEKKQQGKKQKRNYSQVRKECKKYLQIRKQQRFMENRQTTISVFNIYIDSVEKAPFKTQHRVLIQVCKQMAEFLPQFIVNQEELRIVLQCMRQCFRLGLSLVVKPLLSKLIKTRIRCTIQRYYDSVVTGIFVYGLGLLMGERYIARIKDFIAWLQNAEEYILQERQSETGRLFSIEEVARFPHSIALMNDKRCFNWALHGVHYNYQHVISCFSKILSYYQNKISKNAFDSRQNEQRQESMVKYINIHTAKKKGTLSKQYAKGVWQEGRFPELGLFRTPSCTVNAEDVEYQFLKYLGKGELSMAILSLEIKYQRNLQNTSCHRVLSTMSKMHLNRQQSQRLYSLKNLKPNIESNTIKRLAKRYEHYQAKQQARIKLQKWGRSMFDEVRKDNLKKYTNIIVQHDAKQREKQGWKEVHAQMESKMCLILESNDSKLIWKPWRKPYCQMLLKQFANDTQVVPIKLLGLKQKLIPWDETFQKLHLPLFPLQNEPKREGSSTQILTMLQGNLRKTIKKKLKGEFMIEGLKKLVQRQQIPMQFMQALFIHYKSCQQLIKLLVLSEEYSSTLIIALKYENCNLELSQFVQRQQINKLASYLNFWISESNDDDKQKRRSLRYAVLSVLLNQEKLHTRISKLLSPILKYKSQKHENQQQLQTRKTGYQFLLNALLSSQQQMNQSQRLFRW